MYVFMYVNTRVCLCVCVCVSQAPGMAMQYTILLRFHLLLVYMCVYMLVIYMINTLI